MSRVEGGYVFRRFATGYVCGNHAMNSLCGWSLCTCHLVMRGNGKGRGDFGDRRKGNLQITMRVHEQRINNRSQIPLINDAPVTTRRRDRVERAEFRIRRRMHEGSGNEGAGKRERNRQAASRNAGEKEVRLLQVACELRVHGLWVESATSGERNGG